MPVTKGCTLCPRLCGVNRADGETGACGMGDKMRVSRIALHPYEEPPISGEKGSGTVFFCGCSLRCVFCQNKDISRSSTAGRDYSPDQLASAILELQEMGATNINFVTPTHFAEGVAETLRILKGKLHVPVVYNTSGYERIETLDMLEGLVDVYMPDFKYASSEPAGRYSSAPDYPTVALSAIRHMHRQVGKCQYGEDGTLKKGVLVRHLVLPSGRKDSIKALELLADALPVEEILLSLMSQYTPDFALDCPHKELHRRLTRFEYDSVAARAVELGFEGFSQELTSAVRSYTPSFE